MFVEAGQKDCRYLSSVLFSIFGEMLAECAV